jgi:Tol biopolymer transport system component
MYGKYRWFVPGVDVVAGRNVVAPLFPILDQGFELLGAFRPVWRADGSRISFRDGICVVSSVPATPAAGSSSTFNPFFSGKAPSGACSWEWGPTAALADQVIYTDNYPESSIFQMTEGGTHPGTKLTEFTNIPNQHVSDMHWMPDGSGVLYSTVNLFRDAANIFRYDISTKRTTQVTTLEKEFARAFSISPDGRSLVYERCPTREDEGGCNLWIVGINGAGGRELVKNGLRPAWGK